MFKLIGIIAVTWFLFWTGVAQAALLTIAAVGTLIFG